MRQLSVPRTANAAGTTFSREIPAPPPLATLLLKLPDRLPVVVGCLTLAALPATIAGQFRPLVVLPVWAVLVVVIWRLVPSAPVWPTSVRPVLALLAFVGAWTAWGVAESGEYLVVNRDPGFLTLKAWWLVDHPSAPRPGGLRA